MDCDVCKSMGRGVHHDILYNCQTCGIKACTDHINNHSHGQSNPHNNDLEYPEFRPDLRRWSATLSQLGMLNYQPNYREPTPKDRLIVNFNNLRESYHILQLS